jgi:hypothetical protein
VDQEGSIKPLGELKGTFKSVDYLGSTIIVHLESEEFLELKVSSVFLHILVILQFTILAIIRRNTARREKNYRLG